MSDHRPPEGRRRLATDPLDRIGDAIARRVTARPWRFIALAIVLVVAAGSGVAKLEFSNNYRVFFSPDNPELLAFDRFEGTYTKNDNIVFVLQPAEGEALTPELASAIEWLTAEAWQIPYAIRVDSVTNFQHSWADGDDLTVEDLIRDADALPASALAERRQVALDEPLLRNNLISPDARTTALNVTLQYPEQSLTEVPEAVGHARGLADQLRARFPDLTIALSGVSMLNNAFAESGEADAATLMPAMFAVLVVFMFVVLRSVGGTTATLLVIVFSALTALGLAGHAGLKLTPISVTAPIIILTLGVADSIHLLITALGLMSDGHEKRAAIRESVRVNFSPVLITSVTTIIGFLSLNFSDAPPFWDLGNITAMGIGAALVYSTFFLPALLSVMPLRARAARSSDRGNAVLARLADFVIDRYRPILATVGSVALVLAAFAPTIELNDEFVKYFDHRIEFRGDAEWAMEHISGIYLVEFSVPAAEPGGISDPEYLEALARFTDWLRVQPEIEHVYSYSDIIKRLNRNMHRDDPTFYAVPADRNLAAQYLLLYELSLPYGLDLNDRVSLDKSATRVTATAGNLSTVTIRDLVARAETWLATQAPEYMASQATGASVMFSRISQRNVESMLRGNAIAIVLIGAIMVLALRSVSIGALSLVPNALPILMTFGVWALIVRQVGMAAATVTATSLGIVVDDTVHFLSKYVRARREKGYDRPDAVRYAFATVGRAIVSTTVILGFGFAVLAWSAFRINAQMGLLTAIAIVIALLVDLTLLPALLLIGHRNDTKETRPMKKRIASLGGATAALALALTLAHSGGANAQEAAASRSAAALPPSAERPEAWDTLTPEQLGFEIAARADRSDRGFGDSEVELRMVLRNKAGAETERELSIRTLEVANEDVGDKSMVVFFTPADIEGTALLSHAKILDADDQWLYLPALKRVKRISSVNKSGPFVGSEFAFEDFTSLELNKFTYRYLDEQPCDELTCDVVERLPRYEHSGYSRQVAWIDQSVFQVRKVEFYDRRGDLLKTLDLRDYVPYDGGIWRAQLMSMVNHQTGKSTDLHYSPYRFGLGLDDNDFVRGALERVR